MTEYLFNILRIDESDITSWIQNQKTVTVYGDGAGKDYSNVALWVTTVTQDTEELSPP